MSYPPLKCAPALRSSFLFVGPSVTGRVEVNGVTSVFFTISLIQCLEVEVWPLGKMCNFVRPRPVIPPHTITFALCFTWKVCPGLTLIRCTRISISVTKCPLVLLSNNVTRVSEYRQFTSQSVHQRWLDTVFDTYFSFTLFSKTIDPLIAKNGNKQVNNTNFGFFIVKLSYMRFPWQHAKYKQAFKIGFVHLQKIWWLAFLYNLHATSL